MELLEGLLEVFGQPLIEMLIWTRNDKASRDGWVGLLAIGALGAVLAVALTWLLF
ncbi:MAG TPA: hypothetical protein VFZ66_03115 [Herpetosiphonaceae bacterium]